MIQNYTRPQLLIRQQLQRYSLAEARQLAAFVFGPQYDLFRYTDVAERAALRGIKFDNGDEALENILVPYEGLDSLKHIVDQPYSKLYAENLEGQLWNVLAPEDAADYATRPYSVRVLNLANPNKVIVSYRPAILTATPAAACVTVAVTYASKGYSLVDPPAIAIVTTLVGGATHTFTNAAYTLNGDGGIDTVTINENAAAAVASVTSVTIDPPKGINIGSATGTPALLADLRGRPIRKGDIVYVSTNGADRARRTVKAIEREVVSSHYGSNAAYDDGFIAASPLNPKATTASTLQTSAPDGYTLNFSGTWNGLVAGSKYNGYYGARYTLTVTRGGADGQVRISTDDNSFAGTATFVAEEQGEDTGIYHYVLTSPALGGLTVAISVAEPTMIPEEGQVFTFVAKGAYEPLGMNEVDNSHLWVSGTYTGTGDATYIITVTKGSTGGFAGAELRISDAAGVDRVQTVTLAADTAVIPLGTYGLSLAVDISIGAPNQNGFRKGDVYTIHAVSAKTEGTPCIVVLSGVVGDLSEWTAAEAATTALDFEVRTGFSGPVPKLMRNSANTAVTAWTSGDATVGGVEVRDDLHIRVTDRTDGYQWVPVKTSDKGRLFAHWRGLVPAAVNAPIRRYMSEPQITAAFGKYDRENPVCYGAVTALRGAQGKAIWVASVRTNDLAGYATILKQAERVDGIYTLAPMTHDADVLAAVKAHILKVSTEDWKLWRRGYFPTDNPGAWKLIDLDSDDTIALATVTDVQGQNIRVRWDRINYSAPGFLSLGVAPGDLFRTRFGEDDWGNQTYDSFVVREVLEEDELLLETGPAEAIGSAIKFELWKPDSADSQVDFVGNKSDAYADRRVASVWADYPYVLDATSRVDQIDLMYMCAEMAGLRTALYPQQGMTNTEINSAQQAPRMFTRYSQEQLNRAAAKGTWIITQEVENGPLFVRHQLTTDTSAGSLYYEDSVGVNIDDISYAVKDILQPYIGKRNATPQTVEEIQTKMRDLLNRYKAAPSGYEAIGPALIDWEKLTVAIDDVFKDRINVGVDLIIPLPLNNIIVTLRASTVQDTVSVTTNSTAPTV